MNSIGINPYSTTTTGDVLFTSSAGSSFNLPLTGGVIAQVVLDTSFADLDAADYVGTLSLTNAAGSADRYQFRDDASGGGLVVTAQFTIVPEPSALSILCIGVCGLVVGARRRFRK